MKVTFLGLYNYKIISAAMGKSSIEIDFTKAKHDTIIIAGPNGTGKSVILEQLHPFAYTGMGERSHKDIVGIKSKDDEDYVPTTDKAVKRIHFVMDDGSKIEISHFTDTNTGSIKSYFKLNGEEKNPNGNKGSFEQVVHEVIGITTDLLKMIQLGTERDSFIRMNSSNRKRYISNILTELEVFGSLYKSVNEDFKDISRNMRNIEEKIRRLNVADVDELTETIETNTGKLSSYRERSDEEVGHIAVLEQTIESLLTYHESASIQQLESNLRKFQAEQQKLQLQTSQIRDFTDSDEKELLECTITLDKLQLKLDNLEDKMKDLLVNEDRASRAKDTAKEKIAKITGDVSIQDIEGLKKLHRKHMDELDEYAKLFKDFHPSCTVEDFRTAISILDDLDTHTPTLLSINKDVLNEIGLAYLEGRGHQVLRNIDTEHRYLVSELDILESRIKSYVDVGAKKAKPMLQVVIKDAGCRGGCPFERFYNEHNKKDNQPKDVLDEQHAQLTKDLELIDDKYIADNVIKVITMTIQANQVLVKRLPSYILTEEAILRSVMEGRPIKSPYIQEFITLLEKFEMMSTLKELIADVEKSIQSLSKDEGVLTFYRDMLSDAEKEYTRVHHSRQLLLSDIERTVVTIDETTSRLDELSQLKELYQNAEPIFEGLRKVTSQIEQAEVDIVKLKETTMQLDEKKDFLSKITIGIKQFEMELQDLKTKRTLYNTYKADIHALEESYSLWEIVTRSVKPTEGIQLLFMEVYMANINVTVNDVLNRIYDGKLYIEQFTINKEEFNIPYVRNGTLIGDIKKCSKGEESFIGLAFAYSFLKSQMGNFNILLMDEVDGPLDTFNREHFLHTITRMFEDIGISQVILISHNQVFETEDVSMILTGPSNMYSKADVIFSV